MVKKKGYLLAINYIVRQGRTYASLLIKGKRSVKLYYQYDPYFLVDAPSSEIGKLSKIAVEKDGRIVRPLAIEQTERTVNLEKKKFLKVLCHSPADVPVLKHAIPYPAFEFDIPFAKRFIFDFQLTPNGLMRYERQGRLITKILSCEPATPNLRALAFDIETYNPLGTPRPKKDPVLMISYANSKSGVITYKKCSNKNTEIVANEKELIERFCEIVREVDPDILFGYNSGNFDLPYLLERAKIIGAKLDFGKTKINLTRKGMIGGASLSDRIHVDLYPIIRLFGFIGVLKISDFTLDTVANEILGRGKVSISRENIWQSWDSGNIEDVVSYSLVDAQLTMEIGKLYLPLELELSSITKQQLFDTTLSTSGQLVENLLMFHSVARNELIPTKPVGETIDERIANPIQGAFVKLPQPGIYENIAVLDFRSLYPSIIVSFNIDPSSLVKGKRQAECHQSPTGAIFLKKPKALVPAVLEELIDFRAKLKKQLKTLDKGSEEFKILNARVQAIKILANSFYGYIAYARSRWYCRECGESVTAWGRKYIQETMEKAEKAGFTVLYGDTDSIMLVYKKKEDVLDFMEKINKELPEKMELELEGFYPRGVFVSKKSEEKGAKKKYALLGEDGKIKIRGFELVRRDWSPIAKETQYKVLEAILKKGSEQNAIAIVRDAIERLRKGNVKMEELAIVTQLNKDPRGGYEVISPELAAAKKLLARGVPLEKGSLISYVIGKSGSSISEKAVPLEVAKDYDADYYINNQVLPAVMKILKELGYDEHQLKGFGKQKSLDSFFG